LPNVVKRFNANTMASKDRILRQKEETRCNILIAAYDIVKEEGWHGLNMRKIADRIEYTAPIIYEYFSNKDAILNELTKKGFSNLTQQIKAAKQNAGNPEEALADMWLAFWNYAFTDKELYQVMFGVEMTCCQERCPEADTPYKLFCEVIAEIMNYPGDDVVKQKYFTFFSIVHGLISINIIGNGLPLDMNKQILRDAIDGIIKSIKVAA
jgi:AcrR family transcriptional regulator